MSTKKKTIKRPKPPAELEGESLLEWERVCDELTALGTLHETDRAILTVYCHQWQTWKEAAAHVCEWGSVIKWPNGIAGPSPTYKVMKEQAVILHKILGELGLTPTSRDQEAAEDDGELEF